jgi:2,3-bisphosphoglycerate-dependent phosphoglycerate mutase
MAKLILIRHGKSEWNKLGMWTGHTDVLLAPEGHEEAKRAGERLRDVEVHSAHVSELTRTHQTFEGVMSSLPQETVVPKKHGALNERHYGIHTGKNKWEVKESVGDEEFTNIRRSWDHPIPEGETLKDVHARVVPYYEREIMPEIMSGKNVLVVAHGNTLRALVKHLEDISDEKICELEIETGEIYCYDLDETGTAISKEVRRDTKEES